MIEAARLEAGDCKIYALEQAEELVAAVLTFRDGGIRRFYTIYFDPAWAHYSPGQALLFEATALSLEEGLSCDYMTGAISVQAAPCQYIEPAFSRGSRKR